VKLIYTDTVCRFTEIQSEENLRTIREIASELEINTSGIVVGSYWEDGRQKYGPHFKRSSWTPVSDDSFPSGLFWRVRRILDRDSVEILDDRSNVILPIRKAEDICRDLKLEVRDYQIDTVNHALASQRGVINIATNGGKTEIAAMITQSFDSEVMILVVAPDITSVTEISERFTLRGIEYSIIDSSHKEIDFSGINVCSLDSLIRLPNLEEIQQKTQILIWDECDFGSTGSVSYEFAIQIQARYRYFMSGTPWTDDEVKNTLLVGLCGEEIVKISNRYLIDRGWSANPTILFHSSHDTPFRSKEVYSVARKLHLNTSENYLSRVLNHIEEVRGCGIVVLFEHKSQGKLIFQMAKNRGLRCLYLDGGSSKTQREEARNMLETSFIDVIFASSIWNRALDFGYPQHWFMIGGYKASNRIKQKWGRALRKKPNEENRVWIHEYYNFGHKALESHSKNRYYLAIEEKLPVEIRDPVIVPYILRKTDKPDSTTPESSLVKRLLQKA
jgi:superfamily II DNA or RNA helicase